MYRSKEEDDFYINASWNEIMDNLYDLNQRVKDADKKGGKKKSSSNSYNKASDINATRFDIPSEEETLSYKIRLALIDIFEGTCLLDKVLKINDILGDIAIVISRLVVALIIYVLTFTPIQEMVNPELKIKLCTTYKHLMSI